MTVCCIPLLIHKGVSSFSFLIVIIDNTENANAEILQLHTHRWHTLNLYLERTGMVYFGVKFLLAPLYRERERDTLIFN